MAQYRRSDRLNEQLRKEITLLVRGEVRDPRVALATITAVQTSPELDHAKVYFTAMGDDDERKEVLAGLRSAAAFMRRELGKRLHIRRVPELHFTVDRVMEEAQRIERLLYEHLPRDVPVRDEDEDDADKSSVSADAEAGLDGDDDAGLDSDGADDVGGEGSSPARDLSAGDEDGDDEAASASRRSPSSADRAGAGPD
ncbi:MAG TPA: 30S ribosome-binding factor RbfA [Longimicrobium sp.]|nr:30S ribosome-binding factor RbfA [Longimicrobium sp.]